VYRVKSLLSILDFSSHGNAKIAGAIEALRIVTRLVASDVFEEGSTEPRTV
jgi:hypothetical protein